jgi:signal transduction histidine kinase
MTMQKNQEGGIVQRLIARGSPFLPRERLRKYKPYALALSIAICLGLEYEIHYVLRISVAYTHMFYIPIIIAGIWYTGRAILLAVFLGAIHVAVEAWIGGNLVDAFIRAYMFCFIAFVVGYISSRNLQYQWEIELRSQKLEDQYRKLALLSSITRHDILNQLTVLMGYHELIGEDITNNQDKGYIQKAKDAASTIQQQVLFTRDYQNIGVHHASWQRPAVLIIRAVEIIRPLRVTIDCRITRDLEIYADPLLDKVFSNLIDNSVRHGENLSWIGIIFEERDGEGWISYIDDGGGIDPLFRKRLFEPGYGKNTGFGLFLVREILAITRISINENGIFGSGVKFDIRIPPGSWRINAESKEAGS